LNSDNASRRRWLNSSHRVVHSASATLERKEQPRGSLREVASERECYVVLEQELQHDQWTDEGGAQLEGGKEVLVVPRRSALALVLAAASVALPGWTIGSPAVAQEPDQSATSTSSTSSTSAAAGEDGIFRRYYKPDGTERATNPYSFLIPRGWKPVPVSLNDAKLYGLDTRFVSPVVVPSGPGNGAGGGAAGAAGVHSSIVDVFVLPVGNADKASIEEIGDLDDVIGIFGPPDQPSRVMNASIQEQPSGTAYYHYELTSPSALLSAYVSDSQIYIFQVSAPGLSKRQWRESFYLFDAMRDSFTNEARFLR
ncbi:hypothetical protein CLOM_g8374, partial [Closterium sp. NIES-68]